VSIAAVVSTGATAVVSAGADIESTTTAVESVFSEVVPPPQEAKATVATTARANNFTDFIINCLKGFDIKFVLIHRRLDGNPIISTIFKNN
jgi:hypothetical protein